jgi:hypothetical protein
MIASRRFALTALLLVAPGGLLTHRSLGAQIAVNGTATVTFNVPVQLASLDPKLTEVHVNCRVPDPKSSTNFYTGTSQKPLTNGAFNNTVPVQITVPASAGQSFSYICQFSLLDSTTGKYWVYGEGIGGSLGPNAEGALQALAQPPGSGTYWQKGTFTVQ